MTFELPSSGQAVDFSIRTNEIDESRRLTPSALLSWFHEASMANVLRLGLSYWDLADRQLSWVLYRSYLDIDIRPTLGQRLRVKTYPSGSHRLFTYRDYRLFDENDRQIARSSSQWLLLNIATRQPVALPQDILAKIAYPSKEDCLPVPNFNHLPKNHLDSQATFQVHRHHLDWNRHLNNLHFVNWLLAALPDHWYTMHELTLLEITFKSEVLLHEILNSQAVKLTDNSFHHQLYRTKDQMVVAMATTYWRKK